MIITYTTLSVCTAASSYGRPQEQLELLMIRLKKIHSMSAYSYIIVY